MHTVDVSSIRKRFSPRGRWVLDGVDLAADSGTLTAIAGDNGSGKSTFLRILAGASTPTSGRIRRRPRSIGYVPERLPATLRMTGTQYVTHMGRLRGLEPRIVARRARQLFDRLRLEPGPDVPIGSLSKGNSQKVALTQALLAEPGLLVLDEPYSGLDRAAGAALTELLTEATAAGRAVVLSVHDPHDVASDTAYELIEGRLRAVAVTDVPAPETAWMELMLEPVGHQATLADLPGVAAYREVGSRVVIRTADADALLRVALTRGWSLVTARPEEDVR